jgi:carboxymethylenebutenolidase
MSWNQFRTDQDSMMTAGVMKISVGGEMVRAYVARPEGAGPYPSVVLIHHAPGWDEYYREFTRRFAEHGFIAVCPNLYEQFGHGTPAEATAAARAAGGVSDETVVAYSEAALSWIKAQPNTNGKVGVIGNCSGGRHAVLVASRVPEFNAVADLWGGGVVAEPSPQRPVPVIDMTPQLNAPLIGIFGNEDNGPSPAQVDQHEAMLKEHGKTYQFHRYDGAGHSFMAYDRPSYRQQQAMDAWGKIVTWFDQYLA